MPPFHEVDGHHEQAKGQDPQEFDADAQQHATRRQAATHLWASRHA
jgi:hypothetical protein